MWSHCLQCLVHMPLIWHCILKHFYQWIKLLTLLTYLWARYSLDNHSQLYFAVPFFHNPGHGLNLAASRKTVLKKNSNSFCEAEREGDLLQQLLHAPMWHAKNKMKIISLFLHTKYLVFFVCAALV